MSIGTSSPPLSKSEYTYTIFVTGTGASSVYSARQGLNGSTVSSPNIKCSRAI